MKTIYIAGKVTGEPYIPCWNKFAKIENKLVELQYNVINPMKLCNPHWCWVRAMCKCIFNLVFRADAVLLLYDWQESKGARLEKRIAEKFKKIIINEHNFNFLKFNQWT
jgi:hypothetical protein